MAENVKHKQKHVGHKARSAALAQQVRDGGEKQGTKRRAFGVAKLGKGKRAAQRTADLRQAKEVLPALDRTSRSKPPPVLVVVAGPKGSGKTTLIRSLVKLYTRYNLREDEEPGPVTIVLGKEKRITLVECPNDMNSMIDLGKIADVVLLTMDASFGLETSTFEFLTVLQTHGFCKVAGVLCKLDSMKTNKALQKTKKALKHRFWADVYQGAKVFGMSGVLKSGKYPKNETQQLGLWLQRQKMRPLKWRNSHSYALCDRIDRTPQGTWFYGWLRGARHNQRSRLHIPGVGDFDPEKLDVLPDPLPSFQELKDKGEALRKKKSDTLLYAPFARIDGVKFDADNTVTIVDEDSTYFNPDHPAYDAPGVKMIRELHNAPPISSRLDGVKLAMFEGQEPSSHEEDDGSDQEEGEGSDDDQEEDEDDREIGVNDEDASNDLGGWVYREDEEAETDDEDDDDDAFFVPKSQMKEYSLKKADDADDDDYVCDVDVVSEKVLESAKGRFVERGGAAYDSLSEDEENQEEEEEEDELTQEESRAINAKKKEASALAKTDEEEEEEDQWASVGAAEKKRLRELAAREDELELSNDVGGIQNGEYVRFMISDLPPEFFDQWSPRRPVLLCGLLEHEKAETSLITARVRRHRWHPKILKARDPVIMSIGWRRFQTAPIYSMRDSADTRHRFLKYTPEHMHCEAVFCAPAVAPNTPLVGFHSLSADCKTFRACMVGVSTGVGVDSRVVKKLKLQGFPYRIERNTAFIQGMFGTALEASKFEGAALKTVSGIRGALKKSVVDDKKPGAFRATFEDKILMSDIVVCRLWVPVEPPQFCAPIKSHLLPDESAPPMRTVAEVRRDEQIPIPVNVDSVYGANPIVRGPRKFAPHVVPKALVEQLPFASKPKNMKAKGAGGRGYLANRESEPRTKTERAATKMLQALSTIRNERQLQRKEKRHERTKAHAQEVEKRVKASEPKRKAEAKRAYATMGQQQARKRAKFAHA